MSLLTKPLQITGFSFSDDRTGYVSKQYPTENEARAFREGYLAGIVQARAAKDNAPEPKVDPELLAAARMFKKDNGDLACILIPHFAAMGTKKEEFTCQITLWNGSGNFKTLYVCPCHFDDGDKAAREGKALMQKITDLAAKDET